MIDFFSDPWSFEFMQRALVASVIVSVVAAVVGSFVILKGMAFIGDALPHASFGGVAIAFALGGSLYLGGAIAALTTAMLIGFISRRGLLKYDTAIGILFVAAFALGLAVISREDNYTGDLFAFVFGNVLAVTWDDIYLTAAIGGAILIFIALFYKELLFTSYDPAMSAAAGLPVAAFQYGLLALVALTTVIAIQTIGVILVVALLITPAATAQLLVRSLPAIMLLGATIGAASSLIGLYVAWHADLSASASIVLTATALFVVAFAIAPGRGAVWGAAAVRRRRRGAS
ncbi:MAG TPA: metal ABC transporter permease [Dehalococcoidia bacterium]|nr:metal ABC transporter permease [Dehalococcoidia bacterium]